MRKGFKRDARQAKYLRARALARNELRLASEPRESADSPIAMAIKTVDPEIRRLIDKALARRNG